MSQVVIGDPVGSLDIRDARVFGLRALWSDIVAITILTIVIVVVTWPVIQGTIVGQDAVTFFYPMFSFLGQTLRYGHLPGWNPYQFSGMPFAGDPESGWMYLPAMVAFTALPLVAAIKAYVLFHFLAEGLGAYALARALGFVPVGAFAAGAFFALSTFTLEHSTCCPIYQQVGAWTPVLLLGTILAVRAGAWLNRLAAWTLGGLALSQLLLAWPGQGSVYVLLLWVVFGGHLTFGIASSTRAWGPMALRVAGNSAAIGSLGILLGLGGILPRLEANALSTIPGGKYQGALAYEAAIGGWKRTDLIREFFNARTGFYVGVVMLVLAGMAILLARWRLGVPYFTALAGGALVLSLKREMVLQKLLYTVPEVQRLIQHWPQRVAVFGYLGLAFLAAAAINELWRRRQQWLDALLLIVAGILMVLWIHALRQHHPVVASWTVELAAIAVVLVVATVLARSRWPALGRAWALALLVLALFDTSHIASQVLVPKRSEFATDLEQYYARTGAVEYLAAHGAGEGQWRYFGYDPQLLKQGESRYRYYWGDPRESHLPFVQPLLVNNQATLFGLPDIQGYNPLQLRRYADFIQALNRKAQEYHETNVLPSGLGSPLLDVLGARYLVLPAKVDWRDPQWAPLAGQPIVYRDGLVQVVERPEVFPRAWLVHEAAWSTRSQVLITLASGRFDLRQTALVEEALPPLSQPAQPDVESVTVERDGAQLVRVQVNAQTTGMVVLSDVYYPAWHAYIDGEPTKTYATDGTFRGVMVPAGAHTLEFRYEDRALQLGTLVSAITAILFMVMLLGLGFRRWRPWVRTTAAGISRRGAMASTSSSGIDRARDQPGRCSSGLKRRAYRPVARGKSRSATNNRSSPYGT